MVRNRASSIDGMREKPNQKSPKDQEGHEILMLELDILFALDINTSYQNIVNHVNHPYCTTATWSKEKHIRRLTILQNIVSFDASARLFLQGDSKGWRTARQGALVHGRYFVSTNIVANEQIQN